MLGIVDPWRKTYDDKPVYTILVTLETAVDECKLWSGQDINRQEFINYLKLNDIYLFKNVDHFKAEKDEIKEKKAKRQISDERRKQLSEQMKFVRAKSSKKGNGGNGQNGE